MWCEEEISSLPAVTCSKVGEHFFAEHGFEHRLDEQQVSGLFERESSCFGAVLFGIDGDELAMDLVLWFLLSNQLAGGPASLVEFSEPAEPSPEGTVGECCGLLCHFVLLPVVINDCAGGVADGVSVGRFGAEEAFGFLEQCVADKLFVWQGEREDSRRRFFGSFCI